jgi:hypothetical protein
MAYVDYNWADFQGAVLAVILHDFSERLSDDVREKAKKKPSILLAVSWENSYLM